MYVEMTYLEVVSIVAKCKLIGNSDDRSNASLNVVLIKMYPSCDELFMSSEYVMSIVRSGSHVSANWYRDDGHYCMSVWYANGVRLI